ncbi:hypothetical protein PENANT_c008G02278 [Penicillium antarcticum]|uniref:Uncharacterized protein n=1 Tax=Penicillium antarcticum TaxID=416450 RepID=A0A1V6QBF7_9EURO|nr:hypothetical protein PENANT_c008G02278 [Penicillium antarcticum]
MSPAPVAQSRCDYTYDHRVWRTGLPVRSAVLKPHAASTRRTKLVGNINYAPDLIAAIENSASKLVGWYSFPTTASVHKIYSLNPHFKHSRDIIDQFAANRANSLDHPNLSAGQKHIRFSIIRHAFDNALE